MDVTVAFGLICIGLSLGWAGYAVRRVLKLERRVRLLEDRPVSAIAEDVFKW